MTEIPEPFATSLASGSLRDVCDEDARTPEALYGRALVRVALGQDRGARLDLEACVDDVGDEALVELAFVDARQRGCTADTLARAKSIMTRVPRGELLRARACHVVGWIEGKLRRTGIALEFLDEAREIYRSRDRRRDLGRVYDTMGEICAAKGQLEGAFAYYSMSLVEKSRADDRVGMALTIGNIGRAHFRMGRFESAKECFQTDLRISREIGDCRGEVRMLNDVGRVQLALGELDDAKATLTDAVTRAQTDGFAAAQVFALKDLALCFIERREFAEARNAIDEAMVLLSSQPDPFHDTLLLAVQGALQEATHDPNARRDLATAVDRFRQLDVPDHEIPARVALARVLKRLGDPLSAERCLSDALEVARSRGYVRYLEQLGEEMEALGLVAGVAEEDGRQLVESGGRNRENGYVKVRSLGAGGFGAVFLAFDPLNDRRVAYKELRLDDLYHTGERDRLLTSIRVELDAASRIRHPGVARVFGIGQDPTGNAYVVQEYVDGRSLRDYMAEVSDLRTIVTQLGRIGGALAALHAEAVTHRDLKPANILVRAGVDTPVLIDFGIALTPTNPNAFGPGGVVGTPHYMSKEQYLGRATAKSDVFSLGVIVFEWLTGERPRSLPAGVPWSDLFAAQTTPIDALLSGLPVSIAELVDEMLSSDVMVRPTAYEICDRCRELLERLPVVSRVVPIDEEGPEEGGSLTVTVAQ